MKNRNKLDNVLPSLGTNLGNPFDVENMKRRNIGIPSYIKTKFKPSTLKKFNVC